MNKQGSRIAQLNLKSNTFVEAGPRLNWKTFVSEASEFSVDCLKTLQPRVSGIIADVRLMSRSRASHQRGTGFRRPSSVATMASRLPLTPLSMTYRSLSSSSGTC